MQQKCCFSEKDNGQKVFNFYNKGVRTMTPNLTIFNSKSFKLQAQ